LAAASPNSKGVTVTTDPKLVEELLAKLFSMEGLPIAPDAEPDAQEIDYEELAVQVWGHWPGPLDAQQQHDLVAEAKARGLL
jgi:hypothetical protein